MQLAKKSYVTSAKWEQRKWTAHEEFVLRLLAGSHTYAEIALAIGRSPGAVQLRASRLNLAVRAESTLDKAETRRKAHERSEARLQAPEETLEAFVPECVEEPVLPHAGGRAYHRNYYHSNRKSG